eukprot:m.209813 g.209813  ORF g.209813 m.209813 type:complete len:112 (+) comp13776_c0_seq3:419-754(+)
MFEKENKADECISAMENSRDMDGPNAENTVLVCCAHNVFSFIICLTMFCSRGSAPVIACSPPPSSERQKTTTLFCSSVSLLNAACELAHMTVNCSLLNAPEMKREGGGFEK